MNKIKQYIEALSSYIKFMEYFNSMSPFPIYDTELVKDHKVILNKLKEVKKSEEYENLPVVACKYCQSLHILNDELENDYCVKCNTVNEIIVYNNIEEYLQKTTNKNEE